MAIVALDRVLPQRDQLAAEFRRARPFPHVVIPNLLSLDPARAAEFPGPEWEHWDRLQDGYQRGKHWCKDLSVIPRPW